MATVGGAKRKTFRASFWANVRAHPALHGRVEAADAVGEYDPDRPAPLPAGTESLEHGVQHDHRHVRGRQLFPWLRRLQGAARAAPPSAAARSFRAGSASACGDSCMPAPAATDRHTSACSDRQTFQRLQRRPPNPRRPVRRCASASSLRAPSSSLAMNGASPCEATTYTIASPAQSIASTSRCTQRGMRQRWAGLTVHAPAPAWPPPHGRPPPALRATCTAAVSETGRVPPCRHYRRSWSVLLVAGAPLRQN